MNVRPLLIVLLGAVALSGCSKGDSAKPSENTITQYLDANAGTLTTGTRSSGPWELGVVFSATVAGKITQLGAKMPDPGTYRVIVWDFDTQAILRQKTVEQSSPATLTLADVDALDLTPNKKYLISINSQSGGTNKKYHFASKSGGGDWLPFTKGSILVYNACYSYLATATFPSQTKDVKYELYGFPEFTFIPN
jgi:hypothetical protein